MAYFKQSLQLHRKKIRTSLFLPQTFSMTFFIYRHFQRPFLVISLRPSSYKYKSTTAHLTFLWPFCHSLQICEFSSLFLTLSHLQSYNYNCTIHHSQLQITFYNCRNCDQLHVKICPGILVDLKRRYKNSLNEWIHLFRPRTGYVLV